MKVVVPQVVKAIERLVVVESSRVLVVQLGYVIKRTTMVVM